MEGRIPLPTMSCADGIELLIAISFTTPHRQQKKRQNQRHNWRQRGANCSNVPYSY